jgi:PhnB protein
MKIIRYRQAFPAACLASRIESTVHDQFYGDRSASVRDQFGNRWSIATHKEDLSKEEIAKRMDEAMKQQQYQNRNRQ